MVIVSMCDYETNVDTGATGQTNRHTRAIRSMFQNQLICQSFFANHRNDDDDDGDGNSNSKQQRLLCVFVRVYAGVCVCLQKSVGLDAVVI